jgi:hypothetical protein
MHDVSLIEIRVEIIVRHPFPTFFAFGAELIGTDYSAWYAELGRQKLYVHLSLFVRLSFAYPGPQPGIPCCELSLLLTEEPMVDLRQAKRRRSGGIETAMIPIPDSTWDQMVMFAL